MHSNVRHGYPSPSNIANFFLFISFMCDSYTMIVCSVRVSNELGAGHPSVAKFAVLVVNGTSIMISIMFSAIVLIFRVGLSKAFTTDSEVIDAVSNLTPLLAISVFFNGIQPILSGKQYTTKSSSLEQYYSNSFYKNNVAYYSIILIFFLTYIELFLIRIRITLNSQVYNYFLDRMIWFGINVSFQFFVLTYKII